MIDMQQSIQFQSKLAALVAQLLDASLQKSGRRGVRAVDVWHTASVCKLTL
jgi:hypothetical protein